MTAELPIEPLTEDQLDTRGTAAALDRASALIEANGLTSGEYWECEALGGPWTEGRSCDVLGAIGVAIGYRSWQEIDETIVGQHRYVPKLHAYAVDSPHPVLVAFMAHLGATDPLDVMNWSDRSTTRRVVDELRACAAGLRMQADDEDLDRIAAGELVATDRTTVALSQAKRNGDPR